MIRAIERFRPLSRFRLSSYATVLYPLRGKQTYILLQPAQFLCILFFPRVSRNKVCHYCALYIYINKALVTEFFYNSRTYLVGLKYIYGKPSEGCRRGALTKSNMVSVFLARLLHPYVKSFHICLTRK